MTEEKPIKAPCGHYVADHAEIVNGKCLDCAEYDPPAEMAALVERSR